MDTVSHTGSDSSILTLETLGKAFLSAQYWWDDGMLEHILRRAGNDLISQFTETIKSFLDMETERDTLELQHLQALSTVVDGCSSAGRSSSEEQRSELQEEYSRALEDHAQEVEHRVACWLEDQMATGTEGSPVAPADKLFQKKHHQMKGRFGEMAVSKILRAYGHEAVEQYPIVNAGEHGNVRRKSTGASAEIFS